MRELREGGRRELREGGRRRLWGLRKGIEMCRKLGIA